MIAGVGVFDFVDTYTARARLLPGLLTVLPAAVTVFAWDPGNPVGWNGIGAIITGAGGAYLLSFIARDLGKRVEPKLFKKWGGRPTELMLMHSGPMDPMLRRRRHSAITRLFPDVTIPAPEEELADHKAAYARWTTIVTLLISRTRERAKFPLVFEENCNYGFRRNMYGMRLIGMLIASVTTIALGLQLYILTSNHERLAVLSLLLGLVNVVMLLVWIFWTTEESVRRGAQLYSERLLETLDAS